MEKSVTIQENLPINFFWKVDSKIGNKLNFYIDDMVNPVASIEGQGRGWQLFAADLGVGTYTLRWEYEKIIDGTGTQDTGWVDSFKVGHLIAEELVYSEGATAPLSDLIAVYTTSSGHEFFLQNNEANDTGGFAAESASNLEVGDKSWMEKTINLSQSLPISFFWKVDSALGNKLNFYIDDMVNPVASIEGQGKEWQLFTADLQAGAHILKWEYEKNTETSWEWDFGDGTTSTEKDPTHTYLTPGAYTVSLTVTGPGGDDTETKENYIIVPSITVDNFASLSQAISNALPGDAIVMEPGVYSLTSNLDITEDVTLTAMNSHEGVIYLNDYHISIAASNNVSFDGITIRGYSGGDAQGGPIQNSGSLTLRNCRVIENKGIKTSAISCLSLSSSLTLDNTLIAKNTNILADANATNYGLLYSSYYYCGTIVLTEGAELHMNNSTIADNVNNSNPLSVKYGAILQENSNTVEVTNSIMCNNGDAEDFTVKEDVGHTRDITYSSIQQLNILGQGVFHIDDPLFINSSDGNYNLQDGSPCEGGGVDGEDIGSHLTMLLAADFQVAPGVGAFEVDFTDQSAGDIIQRLWDFGDGNTSEEQSPSHTYASSGTYTVSLTVEDSERSDTKTVDVSIPIDVTAPTISITSPLDNTGVASTTVVVTGIVNDANLEGVDVMISAENTYEPWPWIPATLGAGTFSCNIEVPGEGASAIIKAEARDIAGNTTTTPEIRIILGHVLCIDILDYYHTRDENPNNLSSVAAAETIIDFMRPGEPGVDDLDMPTTAEIYNHAFGQNFAENSAPGSELDMRGIEAALCKFDFYDGDYTTTGAFGSRSLGYNYGGEAMSNTTAGFNEYLVEIAHWISWPVTSGNSWYSDGSDVLADPYTPGVLPLYADTLGYSRWVIVNGYAASKDPFEGNNTAYRDAYNYDPTISVYGLFLTDPDSTGLGQNTYVSSVGQDSELKNHAKPLSSSDQYNNKYVMVAEPPLEECNLIPVVPELVINESMLNLICLAEYINSEEAGSLASHLCDGVRIVELNESRASKGFSTEGDLISLFNPGESESDYIISWKDIIDPMLLLNQDFKSAIKDSYAREFIKVLRKDTGREYYVIPFDKFSEGSYKSYAAILVDAIDGHFKQATYVEEPVRYVQVTKEEAIAKVMESEPEIGIEDIDAKLVWEPGQLTSSQFYPYWEVSVGDVIYRVLGK